MSQIILIVDDEEDILEFLEYNLLKEGYTVYKAFDGEEAILKAKEHLPDLIILDVMMPEMDGIEVCEQIKKINKLSKTIICFLTARNESYTQISALDSGGDDFITKPIKPNVLISRVKALLRRQKASDEEKEEGNQMIKFDKLWIDPINYQVILNGKELPLAKKEFELLRLLCSKPSKVFKREEIMQKIWGDDIIVGDRTLDVHIRKIREKIGENYIVTLKGVGYKFENI
jgi:two-component system alkaline phosphatase synthesis response regulator PhoP